MMAPHVVFVDNHLLILDKPAGMSTQVSKEHGESLEQWGKEWVRQHYQKPGAVFLQPIHRLDRPVSGLVAFARTSKALSRLMESSRQRSIKKIYIALVQGTLQEKTGEWTDWLVHDSFHGRIVNPQAHEAKQASLRYHVHEEQVTQSYVEILLQTGRYHQIRVQFSHHGYAIIGDRKYGSSLSFGHTDAIALHHARLELIHPVTQLPMVWVSLPSHGTFQHFSDRSQGSFFFADDSARLPDLSA